MRKILLVLGIVSALAACNVDVQQSMTENAPSEDTMMKEVTDSERKMMMSDEMQYMYAGKLKDVSGGNAEGMAQATFENGEYKLLATFDNLPALDSGFFYEGWVVRKSPFHFVSTGRVDRINGVYTNVYSSADDLTDHTMYVLTLEPDDDDPAPADHIVEGNMKRQ
ncbi:hypothetical protein COV82_00355 [Candidatus Peregrinibacteria bacterium CG11_big_fil_rev_8_21_14_0_20_46_8]|nr:MAG: hypothetical protein COV82_00355 [Candidatus Peregrinibacteria bacterium CG11_big_fil_rev_8_21_14_0_20_46_8]